MTAPRTLESTMVQTPTDTGFRITGRKGWHVTFENGWTVSVQFGGGNYCDNYDQPIGSDREVPASRNAEVAAWDANGEWLPLGDCDDVIGKQSPADVLAILSRVAAL